MEIHSGHSKDEIKWEIELERMKFICDDENIGRFNYAYDPRVCKIEDKYYVTWCNGYHGYLTIGVSYTYDFKEFYQMVALCDASTGEW